MGGLAFHKPIAAPCAGDPQFERLQFFFDAITSRSGGNSRTRLDLPPFAVLAEAPLVICVFVFHLAVFGSFAAMMDLAVVMMCVSHKAFSFEVPRDWLVVLLATKSNWCAQ